MAQIIQVLSLSKSQSEPKTSSCFINVSLNFFLTLCFQLSSKIPHAPRLWSQGYVLIQEMAAEHCPLIGQYIDLQDFLWLAYTWQRAFISALHTDRDRNTQRGLWLVRTGHVTRILASDWSNSSLTYCIFSHSPEGTKYLPLRIPDIWCFLSLRIQVKTLCRNKTLIRSTQATKLFISEKMLIMELSSSSSVLFCALP